jgi:8-oxo-dGTP pyrophosphatase MutT (NUDIX family)
MRIRSAIILIEEDNLALIERHRAGKHYYSFPGGGVDEGETSEQAAVREAEEELGIRVEIKQKVAEVIFNGNTQYYFLAKKISGEFGTGMGEEYGEYNPVHGTYHPIWMPLAEVSTHNVLPRELADFVVQFARDGWPHEPVIIIEKK